MKLQGSVPPEDYVLYRAGPTCRSAPSILPQSWGQVRGGELAQHTCVLVSHRVSDDPAEDDPAGHADGDSTGARKKAREL